MRIWRVREKALPVVVNTLLTSIASYAQLLSSLTTEDTNKANRLVISSVRRQCGRMASDSAALLGVLPEQLGHGIKFFTGSHVAATARELEVLLNDSSPTRVAARSRLTAYMTPSDNVASKIWDIPPALAECLTNLQWRGDKRTISLEGHSVRRKELRWEMDPTALQKTHWRRD